MLKTLKFDRHDNKKVWFISDLHAGHTKDFILNPRGYKDAKTAYESMIKSWNEVVSPDDIVFNLGDMVVGAGRDSVQVVNDLIRRLNGTQYFIWGNHNAGVKQIYKETLDKKWGFETEDTTEVYPVEYNNKFWFLGHYAEVAVDGQFIVLTHYPIESWNEMSHNSWNIHGHCHRNLPDNPNLLRLDVGWEFMGRPVEFDEIRKIMRKKTFKPIDHHGKE